jgi:nitrogen regulatory protein PII
MKQFNIDTSYDLIYVIINQGLGSKVLHKAKEKGIHGGTIYYGLGTVRHPLLNLLALYDEQKEIVLMGGESHTVNQVIEHLNQSFKFHKPNHGIMFRINSCRMLGSRFNDCSEREQSREVKQMYHIITTIVDKGRGEDVVSASKNAGAKGGTIINARGSGVNETSRIFNIEIEPEKEIVMIITKAEHSNEIIDRIREELHIDEPGQGILFVQEAAEVHGLFHQEK